MTTDAMTEDGARLEAIELLREALGAWDEAVGLPEHLLGCQCPLDLLEEYETRRHLADVIAFCQIGNAVDCWQAIDQHFGRHEVPQ